MLCAIGSANGDDIILTIQTAAPSPTNTYASSRPLGGALLLFGVHLQITP